MPAQDTDATEVIRRLNEQISDPDFPDFLRNPPDLGGIRPRIESEEEQWARWEAYYNDPIYAPNPWDEIDTWHDTLRQWWIPPFDWDGKTVYGAGLDAAASLALGDYGGNGASPLQDAVKKFERWLSTNRRSTTRILLRLDPEQLALDYLLDYFDQLKSENKHHYPGWWYRASYMFAREACSRVCGRLKQAASRLPKKKRADPLTKALPYLEDDDGELILPAPSWRAGRNPHAGGWNSVEAFCLTLPEKHGEIAWLAASGMTKLDIAGEVGLTYEQVKYAFRSMREKAQEFFDFFPHKSKNRVKDK